MASLSNNNTLPSQMDIVVGKRDDNHPDLNFHFSKAKYLKEGFNERYRTFAMFTTMHGYLEIQMTRSIIFKLLWAIIICFGLGFTFYQVYNTTNQYVNQSTTTTIEQVKKQGVLYPPMYLCVNNWFQWIDWDKAINDYNYTRKAILSAFSCETDIYSVVPFDIHLAAEEFEQGQKINNISTLSEFAKLVAKNVDKFIPVISDQEEYGGHGIDSSDLFKELEINDGLQLCYKAKSEDIKAEMEKYKLYDVSGSNVIRMEFESAEIFENTLAKLNPNEYASYVYNWVDRKSFLYQTKTDDLLLTDIEKTYLQVGMPLWLFVNGYGKSYIEINPEVDEYKINVKALVNRWLDKPDKPCVTDATYIFPDHTCFNTCKDKILVELFGKDYKKKESTNNRTCCTGKTHFMDVNATQFVLNLDEASLKDNNSYRSTFLKKELGLACSAGLAEDARVDQFYNKSDQCDQLCNPQIGCETWRFEINIATSSMFSTLNKVGLKLKTNLIIRYPSDGETLVVVETEKQSWDNFVGNIGGLLGVWTGASILSFIQIFYLCICAPPSP